MGFLVQASDPNNTIPTLFARLLPTGATFVDQGNGTGVFQWDPAVGQAGDYALTFVASDGTFETERSVNIRVNPWYDTDGDGMDDEWEMEHFGTLDRDGTGDYDGDGRTDLQEFLEGTNPTVAEAMPGTPQIYYPVFDADTLDGEAAPWFPQLVVTNAAHGAGIEDVSVIFEVYSDEGLSNLIAQATIPEGGTYTRVQLTEAHLVEGAAFGDNTLYYWRARSQDTVSGASSSAWVKSRFFINTFNDAPTVPLISSPAQGSVVADLSPRLVVNNSTDVDRDRLYYAFALYTEHDLSTPLAEVTGLAPGSNGETAWRVPRILNEDNGYFWQAIVTDEHGLSTESEWGFFLVSTENHPPSAPSVLSPVDMALVAQLGERNSLALTLLNATDPERMPLTYSVELDRVNTFDSQEKQVSGSLPEGVEQTTWQVENLQENTRYYWRARAFDGELYSDWVNAQFIVNTQNEPPPAPTLQNPVNGSVVATLRPLLEINPVTDPEGGSVIYQFELYANEDLSGLIAEHRTELTRWVLDSDLTDTTTYYWRVRAEDETSLAGEWSATGSFTVTLPVVNQPPQMTFVRPDADLIVETNPVLLQWVDSDPDSSATITLLYSYEGGVPKIIVEGLSEDEDGEGDIYRWDTTGLAPGDYRISAIIADEDTEVHVEHCCVITIPERATKTLSILPQLPLVTDETGSQDAEFDIVLQDALVGADTLTLSFAVSNTAEGRILGEQSMTFDSSNWNQPQTVRVRGVDDCEADGDQSFDVVFAPIVSSDPAYHGQTPEAVTVVNQDRHQPDQIWFVCEYHLLSQETAGAGLVDYTYRAKLINRGTDLPGAEADVTVLPAVNGSTEQHVTGTGKIRFPAITAGESAWSSHTFVLRHAANQQPDFAKLLWVVVPSDAGPEACTLTDTDAAQYPLWQAGAMYTQGQRVSYNNLVWQAKWWNQNSAPLSANTPWELISPVELPWHVALVYEAGAEVNHEGYRWRARWWTQAQVPGVEAVWENIGTDSCADDEIIEPEPVESCELTDSAAANYPSWSPTDIYQGGAQVNYQDLVWEALWWNTASTPDSPYAPWRLVSAVDYPWSASLVYDTGAEANHRGQRWRAHWWIQGGEPGQSSAWMPIGPSSCL